MKVDQILISAVLSLSLLTLLSLPGGKSPRWLWARIDETWDALDLVDFSSDLSAPVTTQLLTLRIKKGGKKSLACAPGERAVGLPGPIAGCVWCGYWSRAGRQCFIRVHRSLMPFIPHQENNCVITVINDYRLLICLEDSHVSPQVPNTVDILWDV